MEGKTRNWRAAGWVSALLLLGARSPAQEHFDLAFSTYAGGGRWEHARDLCADPGGNLYVVGGTASPDFPTTAGAQGRALHAGGEEIGPAGLCDAFVMKLSRRGELLWSTLLGGPNYDRAYAVEVDPRGDVCVAGRAGPGWPVKRAFQARFAGTNDGRWGNGDCVLARFEQRNGPPRDIRATAGRPGG